MKNILIVFTILLIITGCNNNDKMSSNHKTINVEFAKIQIDIPKTYKHYLANDLVELIYKSDSLVFLPNSSAQHIEEVGAHPFPSKIYADSTNLNNRILFQKGEHILLTKELAHLYIDTVEQQLQSGWEIQGIDYLRLASNYKKGNKVQIIEIKYQLNYLGMVAYLSQYIITNMTQTIAISTNSNNPTEFDYLLNSIKFK